MLWEIVVDKSLFGRNGCVPFRLQIPLLIPFRSGENAIFVAETVAQPNGPILAKQELRN